VGIGWVRISGVAQDGEEMMSEGCWIESGSYVKCGFVWKQPDRCHNHFTELVLEMRNDMFRELVCRFTTSING
jgi:hypothetical protein